MNQPAPPPSSPLQLPQPDRETDRGSKHLPPQSVKLPPPVDESPPVPNRWPLFVLAALFAVANFAILPLTTVINESDRGAVLVYICAGLIVAQGGALPFWLVYGRESFVTRLIVFWIGITVLFLCWGGGAFTHMALKTYHSYDDTIRFVGLSLPLAAIAIQLPLWPLKLYFGWSLVKLDAQPGHSDERPLAIRDYLIGTAIVAVAFTLARLAPKRMDDDEFWIGWLIFAASVGGTALISVVPAMLLMLRRQSFSKGAAIMALYTTGAAAVTFVVSSLLQPYNWSQLYNPRGLWSLFGGLLVFLAFAAGLSGAMLTARSLGYRLTFATERK